MDREASAAAEQIARWMPRLFRSQGFQLDSAAHNAILSFLSKQADPRQCAELILDSCSTLSSTLITAAAAQEVISKVDNSASTTDVVQIIDAFSVPKFHFDQIRKRFYKCGDKLHVICQPQAKQRVFLDRLALVLQRIRRHKLFMPAAFEQNIVKCKDGERPPLASLTEVQGLLGTVGSTRIVVGCIAQQEDGHYYLQDFTGTVAMDLSHAACTSGYFTEGSIVMVEGEMRADGVLQVSGVGLPPAEQLSVSERALQGMDFFGGTKPDKESMQKLVAMERQDESRIVVMSNVWLDRQDVLDNLSTVFSGFDQMDVVPKAFVLMGNFNSTPSNTATTDYNCIRDNFAKLASIIAQYPHLLHDSKFVIVPGPHDPSPSSALPYPPLPAFFTEQLRMQVPNITFASNPCRIRCYSQELVFFRNDLQQRLQRSALLPPVWTTDTGSASNDAFCTMAQTVLLQSHLTPLPMHMQPVYWEFDHSLAMYPLPTALVLGDRCAPNEGIVEGCLCFNPGSIADQSFAAYVIADGSVEICSLNSSGDAASVDGSEHSDG